MNKVIGGLLALLKAEFTSANTYFMHYKILGDQGWSSLAEQEQEGYLDEMKHAQTYIERIFFLGGFPVFAVGKVEPGRDVKSILEINMKLEEEGVEKMKEVINDAFTEGDHGTAYLLQKMLTHEEEHLDCLRTKYESLKILGVENYLQKYG